MREGDRVEKGQVLATLDPEPARLQLAAASAALAQATAQRKLLAGRIEAARLQVQRLAEAAAAGAPDGQGADAAAIALQSLLAEHAAAQAGVAMATQKRDGARYDQRVAETEFLVLDSVTERGKAYQQQTDSSAQQHHQHRTLPPHGQTVLNRRRHDTVILSMPPTAFPACVFSLRSPDFYGQVAPRFPLTVRPSRKCFRECNSLLRRTRRITPQFPITW